MYQPGLFDELIIDNFAGGGGASHGIELALNRPVDIAINHDPEAVAIHRANHPYTRHYCEDVWTVDPVKITNGRPLSKAAQVRMCGNSVSPYPAKALVAANVQLKAIDIAA